MKQFFIALLALGLTSAALAGGPGSADASTSSAKVLSDEDAINLVVRDFTTAWEQRDLEASLEYFVQDEDITTMFPNPYAPLRYDGQYNVRKAVNSFFDMMPKRAKMVMTRHAERVQVFGDVGIQYSYYSLNITMGGTPMTFKGRTTFIMKRQQGAWKIFHLHSSEMPEESQYFATEQ